MTFGVYIRCSLFFRFSYDYTISTSNSKWSKRIIFFIFTAITALGAYYVAKEHFRVQLAIDIYALLIVLYPTPFILLFISWWKKRKYKTIHKGEYI